MKEIFWLWLPAKIWIQKFEIIFIYSNNIFFILDENECLMYLFFVTGCTSIGKIGSTDIFRISSCSYVSLQETNPLDSRINDVQKLLMSGCFYFPLDHANESYSFNLLRSLQTQQNSVEEPDNRFFWWVVS